jgi:hypothetical protein
MPVTRDEVEWAYRMLLGREVENEAAVQGHLGHADRTALRQAVNMMLGPPLAIIKM